MFVNVYGTSKIIIYVHNARQESHHYLHILWTPISNFEETSKAKEELNYHEYKYIVLPDDCAKWKDSVWQCLHNYPCK